MKAFLLLCLLPFVFGDFDLIMFSSKSPNPKSKFTISDWNSVANFAISKGKIRLGFSKAFSASGGYFIAYPFDPKQKFSIDFDYDLNVFTYGMAFVLTSDHTRIATYGSSMGFLGISATDCWGYGYYFDRHYERVGWEKCNYGGNLGYTQYNNVNEKEVSFAGKHHTKVTYDGSTLSAYHDEDIYYPTSSGAVTFSSSKLYFGWTSGSYYQDWVIDCSIDNIQVCASFASTPTNSQGKCVPAEAQTTGVATTGTSAVQSTGTSGTTMAHSTGTTGTSAVQTTGTTAVQSTGTSGEPVQSVGDLQDSSSGLSTAGMAIIIVGAILVAICCIVLVALIVMRFFLK